MARVLGIQLLHMSGADVLPLDYKTYGDEIRSYLTSAQKRSTTKFEKKPLDFAAAMLAANRFTAAGAAIQESQMDSTKDAAKLNRVLRQAERDMMLPQGLPRRPWFRHAIYAPGEYTGYAAVVIPGVNEAIDADDFERAESQLGAIAAALNRAAQTLESFASAPAM
jgi:N-acetylated-alpha-linked acidic dipeptidase